MEYPGATRNLGIFLLELIHHFIALRFRAYACVALRNSHRRPVRRALLELPDFWKGHCSQLARRIVCSHLQEGPGAHGILLLTLARLTTTHTHASHAWDGKAHGKCLMQKACHMIVYSLVLNVVSAS